MGDMPFIRSSDGQQRSGTTEGGDVREVVVASKEIGHLMGKQLVQFRMGHGVQLELDDHEVTIETSFEVMNDNVGWAGEPLTADAAGALLPVTLRAVTSALIATDGSLALGLGAATITVSPAPMYEAWQVRGPDGLLIVCSPGGAYVAARAPESPTQRPDRPSGLRSSVCHETGASRVPR
jgi:hypothetical protein